MKTQGSTLLLCVATALLAAAFSPHAGAARPKLAPWAGPVTGPLYHCRPLPAGAGEASLVAWTQGPQLIVAAARERDVLPAWVGAKGSPQWRTTLKPGIGVVKQGDRYTLALSGRTLDCSLTHEE